MEVANLVLLLKFFGFREHIRKGWERNVWLDVVMK